jgi:hypothetical protein
VSTPTGAPPAVPGGPVPRENVAGGTESGKPASSETDAGHTDSGNTDSGNIGVVGGDDDWPTRYSWLEDDGDESGEAGEATGGADATTGTSASAPATVAAPSLDAGTTAPGTAAPGTTGDAVGDVADADEAEEPDAHIIAFPGHAAARAPSSANGAGPHGGRADEASADAEDDDAEADREAETGPTVTAEADKNADAPTVANGAALVTVVPGVPRYHRPDCVLIRFMPEGDVQRLPVAEAKDVGCTPCAACQPTG